MHWYLHYFPGMLKMVFIEIKDGPILVRQISSFLSHAGFFLQIFNCAVPENIHTHPMEGQWKFWGGGGLKGKNFRRKVWGLVEIPEEWVGGLNQKNLPWEGYGYFPEQHIVLIWFIQVFLLQTLTLCSTIIISSCTTKCYINTHYWPSMRSRWLDIGQVLFLHFYGPRWSWGQ